MRMKQHLIAALAFIICSALALVAPAYAQQTAKVVATCGVAGYTAGGVNYQTIDTGGGGCPAGGSSSLTNPVFIAFAEAGDSTGTFTNATQTTSVTASNTDGYATALVSINGTYGTASAVFEASDDTGVNFYSVLCARSDGTASETGYTTLTNTNRQWYCPVSGNDSFRVRSTAVASGTVNVRISISAPPTNSALQIGPTGALANQVQGNVAAATADDASNPVKVGGVFPSGLPIYTAGQRTTLSTSANGGLLMASATSSGISSNASINNVATTGTNVPGSGVVAAFSSPLPSFSSGQYGPVRMSSQGGLLTAGTNGTTAETFATITGAVAAGTGDVAVAIAPTSAAAGALPVTTTNAVASNQVLKGAAGNGYRYAITTGASAGFFMVFDATTAPADGAVTPKICRAVAANTSLEINHSPQPDLFTTGIVEVFSTTGCYTKTASATAELEGSVE